ncbi:MAG: hypothetical protein MUF43_11930 [Flavobacterium sp.]|jgi:hypothetical protein|nr:hypothetical protein [Flavobacterium sp.]
MNKDFLKQSSWFIVNKQISREVGVEASLLLSYLIEKSDYYDIEWFYCTSDTIENDTTLSYRIQKTCIEKLKSFGYIDTKLMGVPAKLHFTIKQNKFEKNANSSIDKNAKLELTKTQNIYKENSIKNKYKENNINENDKNASNLDENSNYDETIDKEILDAYLPIKKHLKLNVKTKKEILKDFAKFKLSVKNYSQILKSSFFFNHVWSIDDYMRPIKGKVPMERMLEGGDLFDNYTKQKKPMAKTSINLESEKLKKLFK